MAFLHAVLWLLREKAYRSTGGWCDHNSVPGVAGDPCRGCESGYRGGQIPHRDTGGIIMAMSPKAENRVRRWREQRWLLDTVVGQVGVEFDQARINYTAGPAGLEAIGEF